MQAEVITQPLLILQGQTGQQEISSVYISVDLPKHFCLGYLALRQYEGLWSGLGCCFSFFCLEGTVHRQVGRFAKEWDALASFFSSMPRLSLIPWWEWKGRKVYKIWHGEELRVFPSSIFSFFCILYYVLNFTTESGPTGKFVSSGCLIVKVV